MLKIAHLGAGGHSTAYHLPALARYASRHPGTVELSALCDLCHDRATEVAEEYGFARVYTDLADMLNQEDLDGCIAVTPVEATADIAMRIMAAGVPLLMEKPPGVTREQGQTLAAAAERDGAQVMVSMNRRFAPSIEAVVKWKADRPLEYLHARIVRHNRRESHFWTTAIHSIDTMRHIAGDVRAHTVDVRKVDGVRWFLLDLTFASGALGLLEVLPTAGMVEECYQLCGPDYRASARWGEGVECWENGESVLRLDEGGGGVLPCVPNGTYGETEAFIMALQEKRSLHPTPSEVLQSLEIALSLDAASEAH